MCVVYISVDVTLFTNRFQLIFLCLLTKFYFYPILIRSQEKVEEDLYIRHKEQEIRESRMRMEEALMAQTQEQLAAEDVARADAMIAAIKVDVAKVLLKTHDKISPEGLENLAKWRVGH